MPVWVVIVVVVGGAAILIGVMVWVKVPTRTSINSHVETVRVPLYVKIAGFLYRDYFYCALASDIVREKDSEKEKILAIFSWVRAHIKTNVPEDWRIADDHPLNVIVRGYGADWQLADVFTTLCVYAGFPAMVHATSNPERTSAMPIAIVKSWGRWLVFDVYYGNYFLNEEREIASIDDLMTNPRLVLQAEILPVVNGISYLRHFEGLRPPGPVQVVRGERQMPGRRLLYELRRLFTQWVTS